MNIELVPLLSEDGDMDEIVRIHHQPSVARYISISDNYFNYVTETDNVVNLKIKSGSEVLGGIHFETQDQMIYLSICVDERFRRQGIACSALKQFLEIVSDNVNAIEVSIDSTNLPSICLFEKLGFRQVGNEDGLLMYRLDPDRLHL